MFLGNLIGLIGLTFAAVVATAQQPPWPAGEERGMANAMAYEVSHLAAGRKTESREGLAMEPGFWTYHGKFWYIWSQRRTPQGEWASDP